MSHLWAFLNQQPEYSKAGQIPRLNIVLLSPLPVCVFFFLKIHNFCRLLHDAFCEFSLCMLHCFGLNLTKVGFLSFLHSHHTFSLPPLVGLFILSFVGLFYFAGREIRSSLALSFSITASL